MTFSLFYIFDNIAFINTCFCLYFSITISDTVFELSNIFWLFVDLISKSFFNALIPLAFINYIFWQFGLKLVDHNSITFSFAICKVASIYVLIWNKVETKSLLSTFPINIYIPSPKVKVFVVIPDNIFLRV
jgi:hypothetical protein